MTTMEMACEERQDFADLLADLSPEQWEQPSLCEHWRVRDVVSHDELSRWGLVRRFVRAGFIPSRANAIVVAEYALHSPGQLTELMKAGIPRMGYSLPGSGACITSTNCQGEGKLLWPNRSE